MAFLRKTCQAEVYFFSILCRWFCPDFRVKKPSNTNLVASRYFKREKGSLLVDVYRSKTSLLKLAIFGRLSILVSFRFEDENEYEYEI